MFRYMHIYGHLHKIIHLPSGVEFEVDKYQLQELIEKKCLEPRLRAHQYIPLKTYPYIWMNAYRRQEFWKKTKAKQIGE